MWKMIPAVINLTTFEIEFISYKTLNETESKLTCSFTEIKHLFIVNLEKSNKILIIFTVNIQVSLQLLIYSLTSTMTTALIRLLVGVVTQQFRHFSILIVLLHSV